MRRDNREVIVVPLYSTLKSIQFPSSADIPLHPEQQGIIQYDVLNVSRRTILLTDFLLFTEYCVSLIRKENQIIMIIQRSKQTC